MILQKLYLYYQRLNKNPDSDIASPGYSTEKIHFALVIDRNGEVVRVMDLRETDGKKKYPKRLVVPQIFEKRTSGKKANFLWDNSKYVLGIDVEKTQDALECFNVFKHYHSENGKNCTDEGYKALLSFLDKWKPEDVENLDYKEEIPGSNIVFKFEDDTNIFLHERSELKKLLTEIRAQNEKAATSQCLVSGEEQPIPNIHPSIKGVKGAQSSGAAVVSFNIDSFNSYNKKQNFNAPIGETAAFSYTTALNHLLRKDSRQKIQIADATTVFWTERESPAEDILGFALDPETLSEGDDKKVFDFLDAARDGRKAEGMDPAVGFYILGLAPNASRLSVRFWYVSTVGEIQKRLGEHYADMAIIRNFPERESEYPGLWRLLRETAVLKKTDNINPLLSGAFMRAILTGERYPREILSASLERIRADGDLNYYRASLIKGYLTRNSRKGNLKWEVKMGLNTELKDKGYRLGRLFAVLEKVQEEANPGLNATIKDRYFSSASATPRAVFPQLIRLSQHHFPKLDGGRKTNMEKLVQEILDEVENFPAHLDLEEQGMFALGYYQQRKDLFTSKKSDNSQEDKGDDE